ncbi:MAG: 4'-phosphopantetheinyl transferase superfamily protein [Ruminococcaceae bacterium]|nr:4'-phosphopantetheinyl transferase superfamily protein [Oscillospiraceae bacterium]
MLFYSIFDISIMEPSDIDRLREKIRPYVTEKVNIKSAESVVSKALLRNLIKRNFGITDFLVDCDKNGKPFVVDSKIRFNISHSGNEVMCVCGDENVGCDIQQIKPYNEKIIKRFFTSQECRVLEESENKDRDFTAIWALKESALKFSGEGLSGGLDRYDFSEHYNKKSFSAYGMCFSCVDLQDHVFAICCEDTSVPSGAEERIIKQKHSEVKGETNEYH